MSWVVNDEETTAPLEILAVGVFNRKRSCWLVPSPGTMPTVELVPCKNPWTAFAVDDRVRSSA